MEHSFLYALGAAFLGGMILNIMPCVLPVLTMKVFNVVEHAQDNPRTFQKHSLVYSAGVQTMFVGLAIAVIALRASGELVGWGMQFQNPAFVAALCALMVIFGLNSLEVFEFSVSMSEKDDHDGYMSSFVNGIVASIMATPCSAPFLGSAAAFALGSDVAWWETLSLFIVIGFGLSFPFILISFVPSFARIIPRPGTWMIHFKKLMGFTLLGAGVWLYGVLKNQITSDGSTFFLGFLLLLSLALWSIQTFGGLNASTRARITTRAIALVAVVLSGFALIDLSPQAPQLNQPHDASQVVLDNSINWAPFDSAKIAAERKRGRPVFVDYTADWCANCKANEKLFLEVQATRDTLVKTNILPMKADLTNDNEEIWKWVEDAGRSALPVYAIYYPDGTKDILPVAITTELVIDRLNRASAKFPVSKYKKSKK